MTHHILQFGFAGIAALCLVGMWLIRSRRMAFLWAAACATIAGASAHYHVAWPVLVFGLMALWALFSALPVMNNAWRLKAGLALYLLTGGIIAIFPTVYDNVYGTVEHRFPEPEQRTDYLTEAQQGERGLHDYLLTNIPFRLVRGLDLAGGLRLVYTVDVQEAIKDKRDRYYDSLRSSLTKRFGYAAEDELPTVEQMQKLSEKAELRKSPGRADAVIVTFKDPADAERVNEEFLTPFRWEMSVLRSADGKQIEFRMLNDIESQIRERAVEQAKQTIQRRVDGLGLKEAALSVRDEDIIIEIPGQNEESFQRIRDIISQTARLEFKMCEDEVDIFEDYVRKPASELPKGMSFSSENAPIGPGRSRPVHYARLKKTKGETLEDALGRMQKWVKSIEVDDDHEIGFGRIYEFNDETNQPEDVGWRTYFLKAKADVTGDMVRYAQKRAESPDRGLGGWVVDLEFTPAGAQAFEQVTGANVKKRFAIILDDKVESAPVIQTKIGGGRAQITMGAGSIQQQFEDATKLELVLRSGALPAPITPSNEQRIGALLGDDAIKKGVRAALIGGVLVLFMMLVFYRRVGLIANAAVLFNLLIQIAVLSMFSASMTLPGIAGLALCVGMAVDANVLINERIKEELRMGKSARAAVATGYDKAFSAIIDGNITTLISGLILAQYGTGPIKGFAVTLIVGICTNLFTGVVVTRLFFEFWVRGRRRTTLGLTPQEAVS